jgi:hypothetical protein
LITGLEQRARFGDAARVALRLGAEAIADDLLQRRHHVVVEEAVHHPCFERRARVMRDQPHRARMMEREVLDDDARLDDGVSVVDEHGHLLQRPERRVLGRDALVAEETQLERRRVLVERDQHLLAVGRERRW